MFGEKLVEPFLAQLGNVEENYLTGKRSKIDCQSQAHSDTRAGGEASAHNSEVECNLVLQSVVAAKQGLQLSLTQIEIAGYSSSEFHTEVEFFCELLDQRPGPGKNPSARFDPQLA